MPGIEIFVGLAIFLFGLSVGRTTARSPSESEMFERLVQARVERKRVAAGKDALSTEVEIAADRIVRADA